MSRTAYSLYSQIVPSDTDVLVREPRLLRGLTGGLEEGTQIKNIGWVGLLDIRLVRWCHWVGNLGTKGQDTLQSVEVCRRLGDVDGVRGRGRGSGGARSTVVGDDTDGGHDARWVTS